MSWLATVGVAFLTAIIGIFGTGLLGALAVEWYRVPSREGGSGYMVLFLGLLGGVLGFIIGIIGSRVVAAGAAPGFLKALGVALGSSVGLLLIATLICWLAADLDTTLHGNAVKLHAEIRCPADFAIPAEVPKDAWYAHINTRSRRHTSYSELRMAEAKKVDGHWIIPMTLELNTSAREKLLYVCLGEKTELFIPRFAAKPGPKYFDWSPWLEGGWETGKPRPAPEQRFRLRFRLEEVQKVVVAPAEAEPSEEEIQEKQKVADSAALVALTPESSLDESLRFVHESQPEEFRNKAGAIIGSRREIVAEMTAQISSPDREISARALRSLYFIKPLPASLAQPVREVGDKLIADIRRFNASKPEDDPNYQAAADAAVLFSAWFQAHHALHDFAGVDGIPRLKIVLELARQREDSYVMKSDVARIADYYVKEWSAASIGSK